MDPRNYRPITTLLQVDYKILAKIPVARMKRVINNFVSKSNLLSCQKDSLEKLPTSSN
jgi:hypothetical protein